MASLGGAIGRAASSIDVRGLEAYFPPGAWWVGRILEMRGQELLVKWHGAVPSWIDAEGEFSAPDEEKLVRILGFQQPSDMGPFVMDDIDI